MAFLKLIFLFFCNNSASINLFKIPNWHCEVKHFEIKHHFTTDHVHKETIDLQFVSIDD